MALPTKLLLEIVTPDRSLVHQDVDEVQLPGAEGHLGVLPGHTPLLTTLAVDELWYRIGAEKHFVAIAGGFGEVLPDRVTVLAQVAERAQDIDLGRAEAARKHAEEQLNKGVDVDIERARIALLRSLVRSRVASRTRTKV
jgi:F-type H+-transporting ATPase subunit epsilon